MSLTPAQAFGMAVRETRQGVGLSQEAAALNSGIDRAYFGHIERATKVPTLTTIWKVAGALDVEPSALLARAEDLLKSGRAPA
jgi:transcriptional regulator with XRE-family HTH domain